MDRDWSFLPNKCSGAPSKTPPKLPSKNKKNRSFVLFFEKSKFFDIIAC